MISHIAIFDLVHVRQSRAMISHIASNDLAKAVAEDTEAVAADADDTKAVVVAEGAVADGTKAVAVADGTKAVAVAEGTTAVAEGTKAVAVDEGTQAVADAEGLGLDPQLWGWVHTLQQSAEACDTSISLRAQARGCTTPSL